MKHPIQPLITDENGTLRFKSNAIVEYLLENGGIDLNEIASKDFSQDDHEQFAQLIGYSLRGFGSLSYVTDETYGAAERMSLGEQNYKDARIEYLEQELECLKAALKEPIARLYGIHPDDLSADH